MTELSWVPKRAVFLRQMFKRALLTFIFFMLPTLLVGYFDPVYLLLSSLFPIFLTIFFFFDDVIRWLNVRNERWLVQENYLVHEGPDGNARMPLSEIDKAFTRLGGRVIVRLSSGQRVVLSYLPYPKDVAEQINAAKPS
ncbi:MAG: hypothetical protein WA790_03200 [Sulfitobacter sp.]